MSGLTKIACLIAILGLLTCQQGFSADPSMVTEMKLLIEKAGPVPSEIINPPRPMLLNISIGEKLRRFWMEKILGFRVIHETARGKACFANQRVILGAVEMYNMDHSDAMIESIDDADVTMNTATLVADKYLKNPISKAESDCYYCTYGNLPERGIVYCKAHGTLPEIREALAEAAEIELPENQSKKLPLIIIMGVMLFTLVFMMLRFRKKQVEERVSNIPKE